MSIQSKKRHNNILSFLQEHGFCKTIDLAEHFEVTVETIRGDLSKIEKEGKLIRKHGGAVLHQQSINGELNFDQRNIKNIFEKKAIAKLALKYIEEGDTIFIDGGTTTWQMAQIMPDIAITIITDSIRVIASLSHLKNITTIVIGGTIWPASQTIIGPTAIAMIQDCYVDKYFFGCQGFDIDWGISESNHDVASIKKTMLKHSQQHYLLIDSQKINTRSVVRFSDIDEVQFLLTDDKADPKVIVALKDRYKNISVVTA